MFSKTTSAPPSSRMPAPPPTADAQRAQAAGVHRAPARAASILASDLVFEGSITGDGELVIDGGVKGDIHVARLVIGEHAQVEGNVRGGMIEIRGHVHGNIEGKAVRLFESAHVEGDITHEQLSIDVGAFFQGRCQQFRPAAPAPVQAAPTLASVAAEPQAPQAQVIELDAAHRG